DAAARTAQRPFAVAGALREDHDGLPAREQRERGLHRLLVGLAALDREGTEPVEQPALPRLVEQLLLGDEVDGPEQAGADDERVEEAAVVGGEDDRPLRDVVAAGAAEAEV